MNSTQRMHRNRAALPGGKSRKGQAGREHPPRSFYPGGAAPPKSPILPMNAETLAVTLAVVLDLNPDAAAKIKDLIPRERLLRLLGLRKLPHFPKRRLALKAS